MGSQAAGGQHRGGGALRRFQKGLSRGGRARRGPFVPRSHDRVRRDDSARSLVPAYRSERAGSEDAKTIGAPKNAQGDPEGAAGESTKPSLSLVGPPARQKLPD